MYKAEVKKRTDRDNCWYVYVPKYLCPEGWTSKKGRRTYFNNKKEAEAYAKAINKTIKLYGQQVKIPTPEQWQQFSDFNKKTEGYKFDDVLSVGLKGVKARSKSILLKDFIPLLDDIKKSNKQDYHPNYSKQMKFHCGKLMESCGNIHLSDFTGSIIESHLDNPRLDYSPNYQVGILKFLSAAFSKAKDMKFIKKNPCADTRTYSSIDKPVEIYTIPQMKRLVNGSPSLRLTHLLGLAAGLRPSECRRCKFEHIRLDLRKPSINLPDGVCKGGRGRTIELSDNWIELLRPIWELGLKGYIAPFPETPEIRKAGGSAMDAEYMKWYHNHWIEDMENPDREGGAFLGDERIFDGHRHTFLSMTYWYERATDRDKGNAFRYTQQQGGHVEGSKVTMKHYIKMDTEIPDIMEMAIQYFSFFPSDSYGETLGETLTYCEQQAATA